jgi:hypothetical protein
MKQLTKNLLAIGLNGIDIADVAKIEFAFSQNIGSSPLKLAEYPGDNTVDLGDNMIGVIWTPEETMLFEARKPFYADTRITMHDTEYQPETPIVKLQMNPTLFEGVS